MKRLILAVLGISVGIIGGGRCICIGNRQRRFLQQNRWWKRFRAGRWKSRHPGGTFSGNKRNRKFQQLQPIQNHRPLCRLDLNEVKPDNSTNSTPPTAFSKAIEILVSPQSNFQQRQAAWKQLREAGELEQAVASGFAGFCRFLHITTPCKETSSCSSATTSAR